MSLEQLYPYQIPLYILLFYGINFPLHNKISNRLLGNGCNIGLTCLNRKDIYQEGHRIKCHFGNLVFAPSSKFPTHNII